MELDVRLHIEPKDEPGGVMPETADEVISALRARSLDKPWRLVEVEQIGELTHRVYASDGVVSTEEIPYDEPLEPFPPSSC